MSMRKACVRISTVRAAVQRPADFNHQGCPLTPCAAFVRAGRRHTLQARGQFMKRSHRTGEQAVVRSVVPTTSDGPEPLAEPASDGPADAASTGPAASIHV